MKFVDARRVGVVLRWAILLKNLFFNKIFAIWFHPVDYNNSLLQSKTAMNYY